MKISPINVIPMDLFLLKITFNNSEVRIFDVKPYINGTWYGKLANVDFFRTVHIANGTVEWADGQDIAPHELYELSVPE